MKIEVEGRSAHVGREFERGISAVKTLAEVMGRVLDLADPGNGRIVNIASIAGKEGNAGMLAYSASKAAVIGLTKVIGKECADGGDVTTRANAEGAIEGEGCRHVVIQYLSRYLSIMPSRVCKGLLRFLLKGCGRRGVAKRCVARATSEPGRSAAPARWLVWR